MAFRKKAFLRRRLSRAGFFLVLLLIFGGTFNNSPAKLGSWNQDAIKATYVGSQLRQIDKTLAGLFLSYDLKTHTERDYRLVDGPGVVRMRRLQSDHSLSQEELINSSYPVFLPCEAACAYRNRDLISFCLPAPGDPLPESKLKYFVKQRLARVEELYSSMRSTVSDRTPKRLARTGTGCRSEKLILNVDISRADAAPGNLNLERRRAQQRSGQCL